MSEPRTIVGEKDIRGCRNESGGPIAAKTFVKIDTTGTAQPPVVTPAGNGEGIYGVAMEDIADGERGDVQIRGLAIVTAGEAIGDGVRVSSDASGEASVFDTKAVGTSVTASTGAAQDIEVELEGPSSS